MRIQPGVLIALQALSANKLQTALTMTEIGRASCRERVYVLV